jgi:hypothetical protein
MRSTGADMQEMADYRIIFDGPDIFMVEITFASGHLQLVAGFSTEARAQEWIATRQAENAKAEPSA